MSILCRHPRFLLTLLTGLTACASESASDAPVNPFIAATADTTAANDTEARAQPTIRALPDWGLATLDLRGDDARPLYELDPEGQLNVGEEGVISMWLRADWDDAHCEELQQSWGREWPEFKMVYANATSSSVRLKVGIHCDRQRIMLENGYGFDYTQLTHDLTDGERHHLVLETDAEGTRILVDGQDAGVLPIGYSAIERVPAWIGSDVDASNPFIGMIAGLRVWKGRIDPADIEAVRDLSIAELTDGRLRGALVGHQVDGGLKTGTIALDPSGVWILQDRLAQSQVPVTRGDHRMQAYPVYTVQWTRADSALAALALGDAGTDAAYVLVVAVSDFTQPASFTAYRQEDPTRFAEVGGAGALVVVDDSDGLQLQLNGDTRLARADRAHSEMTFVDKWGGGGGTSGLAFTYATYDVRDMDVFEIAHTGTNFRPVFSWTPSEVDHDWTMFNERAIPVGLQIEEINRCSGENHSRESVSEVGMARNLEHTWNTAFQYFSLNEEFRKESSERRTEKVATMGVETVCERYALVLDPARARLSRGFRLAVEELAQTWRDRECDTEPAACEGALETFIASTGTHFPNTVVYGGRVVAESRMDQETYQAVKSHESRFKWDVMVELTTTLAPPIGGSVSATQRWGHGYSRVSGRTNTNIREKFFSSMRWRAIGGHGSASYESWMVDDRDLVPVNVDLRPIAQLLSPPFFDDPVVVGPLRAALDVHLEAMLEASRLSDKPFFETELLPEDFFAMRQLKAAQPAPYEPPSITLYRDSKLKGDTITLTDDLVHFDRRDWPGTSTDIDQSVSSIRVHSGTWKAYSEGFERGDAYDLEVTGGPEQDGDYPDHEDWTGRQDSLTSISLEQRQQLPIGPVEPDTEHAVFATRIHNGSESICLGADSGGDVRLVDCTGDPRQVWIFEPSLDTELTEDGPADWSTLGEGRLINTAEGLCLDPDESDGKSGRDLRLQPCRNTDREGYADQAWKLTPRGQLINIRRGMCMDIPGRGGAVGADVQLGACGSYDPDQVWSIRAEMPWQLKTAKGECLQIEEGQTQAPGDLVTVFAGSCRQEDRQLWWATGREIRNVDGLCLTQVDYFEGRLVQSTLAKCDGRERQQWTWSGDTIQNGLGGYLEVTTDFGKRSMVQVTPSNGRKSQQWTIVPL